MKIIGKLIVAVVICAAIITVYKLISQTAGPQVSTDIALSQVNGGDVEAAAVRGWQTASPIGGIIVAGMCLMTFMLMFYTDIKRSLSKSRSGSVTAVIICVTTLVLTGCSKPYDKPEYVEIESNETAFVVPLEGDTSKQVAFESAEQLSKLKVATKRIQILHRWNQTGRLNNEGSWIPTVRVIKVSRTPVTREWQYDNKNPNTRDQAIWTESADSVGFSTGFTCVAMVTEEDTALFLYKYSGQSLAQMMDTEVRGRIQGAASEFCSKYPMDNLRTTKAEMMKFIRDDIVPFFKERGITITTISQFGGFAYENQKIQDKIDEVFIAQQEKQVAKALLEAQKDKNLKLEMEGEGEAAKLRKVAAGQKDAAITEAEGRTKAIELVAEATKKTGQDPLFLELRKLEVIKEMTARWDGKYPSFLMGGSSSAGPNILLNMPLPQPIAGPQASK